MIFDISYIFYQTKLKRVALWTGYATLYITCHFTLRPQFLQVNVFPETGRLCRSDIFTTSSKCAHCSLQVPLLGFNLTKLFEQRSEDPEDIFLGHGESDSSVGSISSSRLDRNQ